MAPSPQYRGAKQDFKDPYQSHKQNIEICAENKMGIVSNIIERGLYWADPGDYRPWPEDIVYIFKTARTQDVPSLSDAERSLKNLHNGIYLHGSTSPRHWCGIFACCLWNEVGLDVRWDLMNGRIKGDAKKRWGHDGLQPGDIAVVQKGWHHFVVQEVDHAAGSLLAIEGNTADQRIRSRSMKAISSVVAYYRPTVLIH